MTKENWFPTAKQAEEKTFHEEHKFQNDKDTKYAPFCLLSNIYYAL